MLVETEIKGDDLSLCGIFRYAEQQGLWQSLSPTESSRFRVVYIYMGEDSDTMEARDISVVFSAHRLIHDHKLFRDIRKSLKNSLRRAENEFLNGRSWPNQWQDVCRLIFTEAINPLTHSERSRLLESMSVSTLCLIPPGDQPFSSSFV